MEREPNRLLRQLIIEAGFSHKGLASRLNDLGAARGTPGVKCDHSSVLRWIGGQRPRDPEPGLLSEIFAMRLGRPVTTDDLGLRDAVTPLVLGQKFTHSWQEGVAAVKGLCRTDVERRRFLSGSTFAIGAHSVGAVRWLIAPAEGGAPSAAAARRVGKADIAAIHE